jgi:lipopolysaccharide transport system permease protein
MALAEAHEMATRELTCFEPPSLATLRPWAQLGRLARFWDLLRTLSIHRVRVRYKQSRLGVIWAILQPLAMMLVFTLAFAFLGGAPSQDIPYAVFAYAALLPWTAFASGLSSASGALTSHASLLTKVAFPREILPVTYVVAALVDFALASTALVVLMVWYGVPLTATALWAIPSIAVLALFLIAAGLVVSALQVRYRDVALAMPVLLQVWMFATPVLYPLDAARHALPPALSFAYMLNPMAAIVDTFRRGVVLHQTPDAQALAIATAVVAVLLPVAYVYFKLTELTMADVV